MQYFELLNKVRATLSTEELVVFDQLCGRLESLVGEQIASQLAKRAKPGEFDQELVTGLQEISVALNIANGRSLQGLIVGMIRDGRFGEALVLLDAFMAKSKPANKRVDIQLLFAHGQCLCELHYELAESDEYRQGLDEMATACRDMAFAVGPIKTNADTRDFNIFRDRIRILRDFDETVARSTILAAKETSFWSPDSVDGILDDSSTIQGGEQIEYGLLDELADTPA